MAYEDPNAPSRPRRPGLPHPQQHQRLSPERSPAHGTGCGRLLLRSSSSRRSASSAGWSPWAATTGSSRRWEFGVPLRCPASLVWLLPSV